MNLAEYLKFSDNNLYCKTTGRKSKISNEEIKLAIHDAGGISACINEISRQLGISHVRVRNIRKLEYGR